MQDVITELVIRHGGVKFGTELKNVVDIMTDRFMGL